MSGNRLFLLGFVISIGVISFFDVKKCHRWPHPSRFVYAGIVFALLEVFSFFNEEIAGVSAIGFTIAELVGKGFVGDCQLNTTGQPQTTAFLTSNDTQQPASYKAFDTTTNTQPAQPPGTILT
jgi:hypothetical protein